MTVLAVTASERAELFTFVPLAVLSVVAAIGMVLSRNAVYAALMLVVNFFCLAGFYVLLEAQFIAAVQVIVYAGAIMVLFLFVLMLLGVGSEDVLVETIPGQRITAGVLGLLLLGVVGFALANGGLGGGGAGSLAAANQGGNVQAIGRLLFTRYVFAFEAVGLLLVVAAVGALVLGKRRP
ncbi:MAG TPA: NADH-quinone oxidoreductase subunit J [Actinomycetes bacterium]